MYLITIFEEMCWEDKINVTFSGPLALKDSSGCQWLVKTLMRFLLKSTCRMEKYYLKKCLEFCNLCMLTGTYFRND